MAMSLVWHVYLFVCLPDDAVMLCPACWLGLASYYFRSMPVICYLSLEHALFVHQTD